MKENLNIKFCKDYRDSIVLNDTWNGLFAGYFCFTLFFWASWFLIRFISDRIIVSNASIFIFICWFIIILVFGFTPFFIKQKIILFTYEYLFKLFRPPIIKSPPILKYDSLFLEKVFIYSHPSMPGILKIVRTKRGIFEKLTAVYNTRIPTIFEIEAIISTPDCCELEKLLHLFFDEYRIDSSHEFYKIDTGVVITKSNELNEVIIKNHYKNFNMRK